MGMELAGGGFQKADKRGEQGQASTRGILSIVCDVGRSWVTLVRVSALPLSSLFQDPKP
jgi:hypothetical protein